MLGPSILARTLSRPALVQGRLWQYNSRSDRHSKVACWCLLFDLLRHCGILRQQVQRGEIAFGINHEMVDFGAMRKKRLDLIIGVPAVGRAPGRSTPPTFAAMAAKYGVALDQDEERLLDGLPHPPSARVGAVWVAVEAKACMTEHIKALPRLFDELRSSQETVHGASPTAIVVGLALINRSPVFRTSTDGSMNRHAQPRYSAAVVSKLRELPRRTTTDTRGYDAFGMSIVEGTNDGTTPWVHVPDPAELRADDPLAYTPMVQRLAQLYSSRFSHA